MKEDKGFSEEFKVTGDALVTAFDQQVDQDKKSRELVLLEIQLQNAEKTRERIERINNLPVFLLLSYGAKQMNVEQYWADDMVMEYNQRIAKGPIVNCKKDSIEAAMWSVAKRMSKFDQNELLKAIEKTTRYSQSFLLKTKIKVYEIARKYTAWFFVSTIVAIIAIEIFLYRLIVVSNSSFNLILFEMITFGFIFNSIGYLTSLVSEILKQKEV